MYLSCLLDVKLTLRNGHKYKSTERTSFGSRYFWCVSGLDQAELCTSLPRVDFVQYLSRGGTPLYNSNRSPWFYAKTTSSRKDTRWNRIAQNKYWNWIENKIRHLLSFFSLHSPIAIFWRIQRFCNLKTISVIWKRGFTFKNNRSLKKHKVLFQEALILYQMVKHNKEKILLNCRFRISWQSSPQFTATAKKTHSSN